MTRPRVNPVVAVLAFLLSLRAQTGANADRKLLESFFRSEPKTAVVVGIQDYPIRFGWGQIDYPRNDATAVTKLLTSQGYDVRQLLDNNADVASVLDIVQEQTKKAGRGLFVFYFSGHGASGRQGDFLATTASSIRDYEQTGIAVQAVLNIIKDDPPGKSIVIFDACRASPSRGEPSGPAGLGALSARGVWIWQSAEEGKKAFEFPAAQRGLFTHVMLQGLEGAALDPRGFVTARSLWQYLEREVPSLATTIHRQQRPRRSEDQTIGDPILALALPARGHSSSLNEQVPLQRLEIAEGTYQSVPGTAVRGVKYDDALYFERERVVIRLRKKFKRLTGLVGIDDRSNGYGKKHFAVISHPGGIPLFDGDANPKANPVQIDVDVSEADSIELTAVDYNGATPVFVRWIELKATPK